jgi:hypothetical protein
LAVIVRTPATAPPKAGLEDLAVWFAAWQGRLEPVRRGRDERLAGPVLPDHWVEPHLLLSQTCGYPLRYVLKDHVRLVATPCYAAPGCEVAS